MRIQRNRWIVKRKSDNKIFCGLARDYKFKDVEDIGNTAIKTFLSEQKAISSVLSSYRSLSKDDIVAVPVTEIIKSDDEDNSGNESAII